ncbi:hypothetical protein ASG36_04685 [Geodermatophilus sp. Leaf369]|uniref:hypothetical protein n=1 Tax=Geodermatophilus sp. Leaf369 TaxID=1736354 RepID=UPI000700C80D|nr:hypothetical protein [Geodermatophilus sp. Leaf369]KQS60268.1 hypothetical protein ASG36_04685 [Geodermatophilus sp. Leaf369]
MSGPGLRLLPRLTRRTCDPGDLLDAAHRLCADAPAGLRVELDHDRRDPALRVEEGERSHRTGLGALAGQITRNGHDGSPAALDRALQAWLDHRPVTDAEAARRGIAVLVWADDTESALGWQVVVHRGDVVVGWVPHPFTHADTVTSVRAAAAARAADVVVRCSTEGPVLLLDADDPLLATAALSAPEQVLATAGELGLRLADARVVVTPGRPVAWAEPAVAARLAGETVEPSVTLPWSALPDLPWL